MWDDENYYLIAYNSEDGTIRHYRVDKMLDISTVDERREGKEEFKKFDLPHYTRSLFGMFGGEERKITPGKKKCELTLTVSLGPRTMKLLDVSSLDYREASMKLRKLGLKVTTESAVSDVYEVGYVIKTSPEAGTTVEA